MIVMQCSDVTDDLQPVWTKRKVFVSLFLLLGKWAPKIPREVLECN